MRASWRPAHLLLLHHPLADDLVDGGLGEGTGDDLASPPERDLAPSSHRVYERAIGAGDFAEGGSAMRIVPHLQSPAGVPRRDPDRRPGGATNAGVTALSVRASLPLAAMRTTGGDLPRVRVTRRLVVVRR